MKCLILYCGTYIYIYLHGVCTGSGPVVLENSPCTGSERDFGDCPGIVWGGVGSECTHDNDAGVVCTDGESVITYRGSYYESLYIESCMCLIVILYIVRMCTDGE